MTHIRDFLVAAAPAPEHRLDAAALIRQSRAGARARLLAWGTSILAGLAALSGGWTQLQPAGEADGRREAPAGIEVVDAEVPQDAASAGTGVVARGVTPSSVPRSVAPVPATEGALPAPGHEDGVATTAAPTEVRSVAEEVATEPPFTGGRPLEECVATRRTPRCTYVATVDGGYRASGVYEIVIERNGERFVYGPTHHDGARPHCAQRGFIRPGDRVTVSVPEDTAPDPTIVGPSGDSSPRRPSMNEVRVGSYHNC